MTFLDRIFHPFRERDQAIRDAKTVAVVIEENYYRKFPAVFGPPTLRNQKYSGTPRYKCGDELTSAIRTIIKRYKLKIVDTKQPHDLELRVLLAGTCIPQLYVRRSNTKLPVYSGAKIQGTIYLDPANDLSPYTRGFWGVEQPLSIVTDPGSAYGKPL